MVQALGTTAKFWTSLERMSRGGTKGIEVRLMI